jgi:hypothetical protein
VTICASKRSSSCPDRTAAPGSQVTRRRLRTELNGGNADGRSARARASHTDLAAGVAVDTGKEFAFHIPGSGVVWAQNGRTELARRLPTQDAT